MNTKTYDETSGEFGKAGEQFVADMMRRRGFKCTVLPHGTFGADLLCESQYERFYVETERRTPKTWKPTSPVFPYPTYNYLARRKLTKDRILVVLRSDMKTMLVVFSEDAMHAETSAISNVHVKNECARLVPVERCILIGTDEYLGKTFAEINADRVRAAVGRYQNSSLKWKYLGSSCPYGISDDEYRRMLNGVTADEGERLVQLRKPVMQPELF
jgi:hypothetical protein